MEVRRTKLIQEFRAAREELLDIDFATATTNIINFSRPYGVVTDWLSKWTRTFRKYYALNLTYGSIDIESAIQRKINGYEREEDVELFNDLRPEFVTLIDIALSYLDQQYQVKPLLEEYTTRVADTKLAVLLNEFIAVKDVAPNHAAIGFRTILSLVIQEKAKKVNPTSNTATCTDLAPKEMIDRARNDQILSPDEMRFVTTFVSIHSDIYNLVAHRPGARNLVDKSEVDAMVGLLNQLLPSIIN